MTINWPIMFMVFAFALGVVVDRVVHKAIEVHVHYEAKP